MQEALKLWSAWKDDYQQFFGIMKNSQNVLICCQAFRYVGYMRYNAIQKLHRVLKSPKGVVYFPLTDVSNLLGCDNVETAVMFVSNLV